MDLGDRRTVRNLLQTYGLSAQKKYGQNFLTAPDVLDTIVEASGINGDDTVLEIGPGLGSLTTALSARAGRVIAVEIDDALIPVLDKTLEGCENVTVINADILKCDLDDMNERFASGKGFKVVANLPYYITTPIVLKLLEHGDLIKSITVMIQKEVALRMKAGPGSKDYGALSLAVSYYAEPVIITEVASDCFLPAPAVDSAVIRLDAYDKPPVEVNDPDYMFKLIRATFNMRRKTMPNALCAGITGLSRDKVESALSAMDKPATIRGETFTLEEFALLSNILGNV